jgi:tRNA(Ile)-lysidine synthase
VLARLEKIRETLLRLRASRPALIGVSGGRDSIALLHLLVSSGWKKLMVAHLNHQLRGRASAGDAAFVRRMAQSLGLRCEIGNIDAAKQAQKKKLSIETAARHARREFFARVARKHRCGVVFLAHHADDQAETVLHNLFRGSSLRGVAGMAPIAPLEKSLHLVRPALDASRREVDDYIATHRLKFREDGSNASPEFTRNRVRHELLPLLGDIFRRDVAPLITRFAEHARHEDDYAQATADRFAKQGRFVQLDGSLRVDGKFLGQHLALQARILWNWLKAQCGGIGSREIMAALEMLKPGGASRLNLPGGAHLCHDGRRVWLEPNAKPTARKSRLPRRSRRC